jgi:N utilization substance protein B
MSSRRQIREAVVQFLYAADPSEPFLPTALDSPALELLLEPLQTKCSLARAKAVVHLQQGRSKFLQPFRDLVARLTRLDLSEEDEAALPSVRTLYDTETDIEETLDVLTRELHGNKEAERLESLLEKLRLLNQQSRAAMARFHDTRTDLPALITLRKDAIALTADLPRYAERLEQSLDPEPPNIPELKKVRNAHTAIADLRREVTTRLEGLTKNLSALDERINASLENYHPDRVDRVDRAILRLATYELLHCDDIPAPVVIDEAIELAKSFGTTDSPRFVNGILDRIRKDGTADPA